MSDHDEEFEKAYEANCRKPHFARAMFEAGVAAAAPKWISVKELPEREVEVAILRDYRKKLPGFEGEPFYAGFGWWKDGRWFDAVRTCWCDNVAYWSPLPPLPASEKGRGT